MLYRADRLRAPDCAVPVEPIAPADGWCDDVAHPAYNTRIRLPHEARHEVLWRQDPVYDIIGILGWNDAHLPAWSLGFVYLPALAGIEITAEGVTPITADISVNALEMLRERLADVGSGRIRLNSDEDADFFAKTCKFTPYALEASPLIAAFTIGAGAADDEDAE